MHARTGCSSLEGSPEAHTMGSLWRLLSRGSALAVWTLGLEVLWGVGVLVAAPTGRGARWRRWIFRTWGRGVPSLLGITVHVRGTPPTEPGLLVSNHLSYIDIPIYAGLTGNAFVAKSEVRSWPAVGWLARSMGTLFIDRANKRDIPRVVEQITARFREGQGIVIFPEGTSTDGSEVRPFYPSLLAPAAAVRQPVSYSSIKYRTPSGSPPASRSVCWWGDMTFAGHFLSLLRLPSIDSTVTFGTEPVVDSDRKRIAERLCEAVRQIHSV